MLKKKEEALFKVTSKASREQDYSSEPVVKKEEHQTPDVSEQNNKARNDEESKASGDEKTKEHLLLSGIPS